MSADITQDEADRLLAMEKHYHGVEPFMLPMQGDRLEISVHSADKSEKFLLDLTRGMAALHRITYQNRARVTVCLIRIDLGGAPHRNPDGEELPCPHIHLYRAGYGDKWAFPLPDWFDKDAPIYDAFQTFMDHCHVVTKPDIQVGLFT